MAAGLATTTFSRSSTSTARCRDATWAAWRATSTASSTHSQKELPRGSQIVVRGQIETMRRLRSGTAGGLVFSIVLVYLLIVVNFQSLAGSVHHHLRAAGGAGGDRVVPVRHATRTLSVPALMGAIMCMGVATANSILVVSFAKEQLDEGSERHRGGAAKPASRASGRCS